MGIVGDPDFAVAGFGNRVALQQIGRTDASIGGIRDGHLRA
jgi:hypothetical protein